MTRRARGSNPKVQIKYFPILGGWIRIARRLRKGKPYGRAYGLVRFRWESGVLTFEI
jgi:hypothetical protein